MIIGGNEKTAAMVAAAKKAGAHIEYKNWVDFEKLPSLMARADICLAGPFGDTYQAQYVITGKQYQYLSMARPTIVGINEESSVFSDKKDSLLVPQANANALAEAINWGYEHQEELSEIGLAGHTLYEKELSQKAVNTKLAEVLGRLRPDKT